MLISMPELTERWGVRPDRVIHVGAHTAEEAAPYLAAGVRHVIWVDPHPDTWERLREGRKAGPPSILFPYAAMERDLEWVDLHKTSNICSSSLLPMKLHREVHPDVTPCGTVRVLGMRMDTLLHQERLDPTLYSMANLDVQGAELRVLRGMEAWLRTGRWIYTEINTRELYEGCVLLPELEGYLSAWGFRLAAKRMFGETHGWGDALFIREL